MDVQHLRETFIKGRMGSLGESVPLEIFVPAGEARAFTVKKGQIFRVSQVEGGQVADLTLLNFQNPREGLHIGHSVALNCIKGIGNIKKLKELYSRPPYENVMATVVADTVGVHWAYMGSRCTRLIYKVRDKIDSPPHRNCQDNLAEALAPYGIRADEIPDVFNLWMDVEINEEGRFTYRPTPAKKGDHIDFRAEMDLLGAISACPNDTTVISHFKVKPLLVTIFEKQ